LRHNLNRLTILLWREICQQRKKRKGEFVNNRILFFGICLVFITAAGLILKAGVEEPRVSVLKPLRIALTPLHDPDQLLAGSKELAQHLSDFLGREVKIVNLTDYSLIVQALEIKNIDVAFMPGLPTVFAIETADSRPICIEVQRGKTTYRSRILVRKDSGINSLAELEGQTIGFTDVISSSGFIYPLGLFYDAGLIKKGEDYRKFFSNAYMLGGYETTITSMYNGQVKASCGSQHAPLWYLDEEQRKEVKVLAESEPLPTHGIVVRNSLGDETIKQIQDAFMALNHPDKKNILKELYHADGLEKADVTTYDSVYQKAKQVGIFDHIFKNDKKK
jgi:phosphonate transport system substrate-binding protein